MNKHMNKPILGVDVDLTTLRSDKSWWLWLKNMCQDNDLPWNIDDYINSGNKIDYNLSKHFPPLKNRNVEPMDFWRQEGVYDHIYPVDGVVDCIKRLMSDYKIVFVTHNKGNGGRSKFNNLDRLFGKDNFSFVVTKEKYLVRMDYLIDDRNDFLNNCHNYGIIPIKIATPFIQYEEPHPSLLQMKDWREITRYLMPQSTF